MCLKNSLKLTSGSRFFVVGSSVPYGNSVGNAIVAKLSVSNSLSGVCDIVEAMGGQGAKPSDIGLYKTSMSLHPHSNNITTA